MKKIYILFLFILLMLFSFTFYASAAKEAVVFSDEVNAAEGETFFVPLNIENNPGLMGFRLAVIYDSDILSPVTVSKGTVTQSGMFDNSIGSSEPGTFDIIWNNTVQTEENGSLAVIGFRCSSKVKENTEIRVEYKPEDTFNEKYEDVFLDCRNISVKFNSFDVIDEDNSTEYTQKSRDVTPEDIVVAVETVQGDPKIEPTPAVKDAVNSLLSQITSNPEPYFDSPEEISPAYVESAKETFIKDILSKVEPERVSEIIQNALDLTGADSIEAISEDRKVDFVNNVESGLKEELPDVRELSDYISRDDEVIAISELLEEANEEIDKSNSPIAKISGTFSQHRALWIVCIACAILISVLIVLIVHGKSRRKNISHSKKKN